MSEMVGSNNIWEISISQVSISLAVVWNDIWILLTGVVCCLCFLKSQPGWAAWYSHHNGEGDNNAIHICINTNTAEYKNTYCIFINRTPSSNSMHFLPLILIKYRQFQISLILDIYLKHEPFFIAKTKTVDRGLLLTRLQASNHARFNFISFCIFRGIYSGARCGQYHWQLLVIWDSFSLIGRDYSTSWRPSFPYFGDDSTSFCKNFNFFSTSEKILCCILHFRTSDSGGGGDSDDDDGDPDILGEDVLWFTPSVAWVEMLNGKILIWKLGRRLDKGM